MRALWQAIADQTAEAFHIERDPRDQPSDAEVRRMLDVLDWLRWLPADRPRLARIAVLRSLRMPGATMALVSYKALARRFDCQEHDVRCDYAEALLIIAARLALQRKAAA